VLALTLLAGGGYWLAQQRHGGPPIISGTIETDEVQLASRYGGRVTALHVREGDTVAAGQLIAELEAPELRARRQQAAAALAEAEAGPRTNEIAATRAELDARQAELALARLDAQRTAELYAQKTASAERRDQTAAQVKTLEQQVRAAAARHQLLVEGTRPEVIAQARAKLAELDAQIAELRVTAPAAGVLETLTVKAGDVLPANRPLATLLLVSHLWVRVYVPENSLAGIEVGQTVRVQADGTAREFAGTVEQIARQAEFTPRNVQTVEERVKQMFAIKIRLPADTGVLRPGMSVDVRF